MRFYSFAKILLTILFKPFFRIEIQGKENININGKLIVCANHIHVLDPIFIAIVFPRQIKFMAKKELFKNSILKTILYKLGAFPVDRDGADLSAIKNSLKVLKSNDVLGIFPEGTRMNEEIKDNAKPGIAMISIKSQAPVLPIYINASYKLFSKIKVKIGKPTSFDEYYDKKLGVDEYKDLSEKIMGLVFDLKSDDI